MPRITAAQQYALSRLGMLAKENKPWSDRISINAATPTLDVLVRLGLVDSVSAPSHPGSRWRDPYYTLSAAGARELERLGW